MQETINKKLVTPKNLSILGYETLDTIKTDRITSETSIITKFSNIMPREASVIPAAGAGRPTNHLFLLKMWKEDNLTAEQMIYIVRNGRV